MSAGTLSPLQRRILVLLADLRPSWTLTGGAALAGVYLGHRTTRDLDLFWRGATSLGASAGDVEERLRTAGLTVAPLERQPGFVRLRVADDTEVVVVHLVAEPVASIEPPETTELDGAQLQVDSLAAAIRGVCTVGSPDVARSDLGHGIAFLARGRPGCPLRRLRPPRMDSVRGGCRPPVAGRRASGGYPSVRGSFSSC